MIVAPKDAERQREFMYIIYEKQIFLAPHNNGGVCFLYQDDGRMVASVGIIGGITDPAITDMLTNTADFRKLVYSIGVSASIKQGSTENLDFILQMYGDPHKVGESTVIRENIVCDGSEHIIKLDEVTWGTNDVKPGQIRFESTESNVLAEVNVRLYLNDGYHVPPFEAATKVDTSSSEYRKLIERSLVNVGNLERIGKVFDKMANGEKVKFAYIGGSITQGAGSSPINTECYTRKNFEYIKKNYGEKAELIYTKAGVGGTPSELGVIRYENDVLEDDILPDVVVIEFAVNDDGDETKGRSYESLVRKVLNAPNKPAVILIFAVFASDFNLEERLRPIGFHYDIPMVSVKEAVTEQFYKNKDTGRVIAKAQYFYDKYHPTNLGHTVMADCLNYFYEVASGKAGEKTQEYFVPGIFHNGDFEDVKPVDRRNAEGFGVTIDEGSFAGVDTVLQSVERNMDVTLTPEFPHNYMHTAGAGDKPLTVKGNFKKLFVVVKDDPSISAGVACIEADGKHVKDINPNDIGWIHCSAHLIIDGNESKEHEVKVSMAKDGNFTVLGFGIVK